MGCALARKRLVHLHYQIGPPGTAGEVFLSGHGGRKTILEDSLERDFLEGEIIGHQAHRRNGNTIYWRLPGRRADTLLTALDLAGIAASSGSACSTGAIRPSRVMMSMGYSEDEAREAVRFSFGPDLTLELAREFYPAIKEVVGRFL